MGITITAKGHIDRIEDIALLTEFVQGYAADLGWKCSVLNDDFAEPPTATLAASGAGEAAVITGNLGLKGVVVSVGDGCETVALLFNRSRELTNVMQQLFHPEADAGAFTSCKTQFGSVESHIGIIELLSALKDRFISDLVVQDEGEYWESRDPERLAHKRAVLQYYQDHATEVIRAMKSCPGERLSAEELASRIEQELLQAGREKVVH